MSDDAERLGRLERERANLVGRMQRAEADAAQLRAELAATQSQLRVQQQSQAVAWSYYRRTRTQRDHARTLRRRAAQRALGMRRQLRDVSALLTFAQRAADLLRWLSATMPPERFEGVSDYHDAWDALEMWEAGKELRHQ